MLLRIRSYGFLLLITSLICVPTAQPVLAGGGMWVPNDPVDISHEVRQLRLSHAQLATHAQQPIVRATPPKNPVYGDSNKDQALSKKLQGKQNFSFNGTTIREFTLWLRMKLGVDVRIHHQSLEDVNLQADEQVISFKAKNISFRSGLNLILARQDLTWSIDSGGIIISTRDAADEMITTSVYPIWDLVKDPRSDSFETADFDTLSECLTAVVQPDSWQDVGGLGTVSTWKGSFVIGQTSVLHDETLRLFGALRQFQAWPSGSKTCNYVDLNDSPQDKKIAKQLQQDLSIEKQTITLAEFVSLLEEKSDITHLLDVSSLQDESIDASADEVEIDSFQKGTHETILRRTLESLGLTFHIDNEVIVITTKVSAEETLRNRVVSVAPLVSSEPASRTQNDFTELIDLITSTVTPDSWDDVGGPGTIQALPSRSVLIISNTSDVLETVQELLKQLTVAQSASKPQLNLKKPSDMVVRVYPLATAAEDKDEQDDPQPAEPADKVVHVFEKMLDQTDNAINNADSPFSMTTINSQLIVTHRRDAQKHIQALLSKLGMSPNGGYVCGFGGGIGGHMGGGGGMFCVPCRD